MHRAVWVGACLLMATGLASAGEVFPLYGTGFSSGGSSVPAGGTDGNWTLESGPGGSVSTPYAPFVTEGSRFGTFPFTASAWLRDGSFGSTSEWVSPDASETSSNPFSATIPYVYEETFNLTGYDPSSVVITGEWSADNYGYIVVNGVQVTTGTDGNITNSPGQFKTFTDFVLNSSNADFVSGVNTIQFDVFNTSVGSPDVTGVNVDILSDFADVPEPASLGLVGLGFAVFGLAARKRKRRD